MATVDHITWVYLGS